MTLLQKSGDGSVSDEVFNPVIDHLNAAKRFCLLHVASLANPLTTGAPEYIFQEADLQIQQQDDSNDFSLDSDGSGGVVKSAAGGRFQFGFFLATGGTPPTIDAGSPLVRYLWSFAQIGGPDVGDFPVPNPFLQVGLDQWLPAVAPELAVAVASVPGISQPGDPVLSGFGITGINMFGTDSITLDGSFTWAWIWEI